jgi:hypothetical protein
MPFDAMPADAPRNRYRWIRWIPGSSQKPSRAASLAGLHRLVHVLRHRELWPEDFTWDYRSSDTCAIGLAGRMGLPVRGLLDVGDYASVFYSCRGPIGFWGFSTQPEHVADKLEAVLTYYER